jgi:hypothetical protein
MVAVEKVSATAKLDRPRRSADEQDVEVNSVV